MRYLRILSLGLLTAITASAQKPAPAPDVLVFTNGDQLTGHLERAAGGSVVFKSDMAGELTIPFDKVKEIHSSSSFSMLKKGPPSRTNLVGQGQVAVADGNVTVSPVATTEAASAAAATLPVKDVGYLVDTPSYDREVQNSLPLRKGWTGAVSAGATLVRSTDNNTVLTGGIALVRTVPSVAYLPLKQRMTFDLNETYGKSTSPLIPQTVPPTPPAVTKTSIFHADAEHDRYFTPRLYGLGDVSFDHNYAQGLSLEQLYGLGVGWTPIQTARQQLDLKVDIHFEREAFFIPANDVNLIGDIFGEAYKRTLPGKIAFTEIGSFTPSWNHPSDYSAMASAGFVLPAWKRLGVNFNVTDGYLSNPSPGYNPNSFQFVAGLAYAIK